MLKVLKQALKSGIRTNKFPREISAVPPGFQGKPVVDFARLVRPDLCADACPTGAMVFEVRENKSDPRMRSADFLVDYGKCILCGECMRAAPESITASTEFQSATNDKTKLSTSVRYQGKKRGQWEYVESLSPSTRDNPQTDGSANFEKLGADVSAAVRKIFGRSLHIRQVDAGSCNGCEVEINALNNPVYDIERFGIHFVASPRHADMLLVTGPVTRNMEVALKQTYEATPDPKLVVAVGACGISGGIFGETYASRGGVDKVIPVDVFIPGCPPRPEALLQGILMAMGNLSAKGNLQKGK